MSWTDVTEPINAWIETPTTLYVEAGYWFSGYTVGVENQWTEITEPSNTWTVIG